MSLKVAVFTHRSLDADTSLYTKSAISGVSAGGTAMQSVSSKLDEVSQCVCALKSAREYVILLSARVGAPRADCVHQTD